MKISEILEGREVNFGANFRKSRGEEELYGKFLLWGGMDIFWNHTFAIKQLRSSLLASDLYQLEIEAKYVTKSKMAAKA